MKRSFRDRNAIPILTTAFLLVATVAGGPRALAEGTADPNQLLAFKKIYLEPVKDNVDGTFQ
ncbi:MAG: hypothetical protein HY075_14955, partial [Deltaproteobacteria bacterium]|nr:hypothetical protein [Deltaproteobacteria bacterium]